MAHEGGEASCEIYDRLMARRLARKGAGTRDKKEPRATEEILKGGMSGEGVSSKRRNINIQNDVIFRIT